MAKQTAKQKISSPKLYSIGDFNAVMSLLEKNVDDHFFVLFSSTTEET